MAHEPFLLKRTGLARLFVNDARTRSALFLVGPRGTGKTTFLRHDMVPLLDSLGFLSFYLDFDAQRSADPVTLIWELVQERLAGRTKAAASARRPRKGDLASDVKRLVGTSKAPVALVLDEVLEAISLERVHEAIETIALVLGVQKLGLEIDPSGFRRLVVIATSSRRERVIPLVTHPSSVFYGAAVSELPLLARDFTDPYTAWVNAQLVPDRHFTQDGMDLAFGELGGQLELLGKAVSNAVFPPGPEAIPGLDPQASPDDALFNSAIHLSIFQAVKLESEVRSLSPTQRAVIHRMAKTGDAFVAFEDASLASYAEEAGMPKVSLASVQRALSALCEIGMVSRSGYGKYRLEEAFLQRLEPYAKRWFALAGMAAPTPDMAFLTEVARSVWHLDDPPASSGARSAKGSVQPTRGRAITGVEARLREAVKSTEAIFAKSRGPAGKGSKRR